MTVDNTDMPFLVTTNRLRLILAQLTPVQFFFAMEQDLNPEAMSITSLCKRLQAQGYSMTPDFVCRELKYANFCFQTAQIYAIRKQGKSIKKVFKVATDAWPMYLEWDAMIHEYEKIKENWPRVSQKQVLARIK